MKELMEGTGVYWYPHQRAYCSSNKSWVKYLNAALDLFFTKEQLAASCAIGQSNKRKTKGSHQPLNLVIVQALIGI